MSDTHFRSLVPQRHRHLKWKAFDALEAVLMVCCGICIFMLTLAVFCDVVTRVIGAPWVWLQQVTAAFFAWGVFVGMAATTRRNYAPQRPFLSHRNQQAYDGRATDCH